ncbi:type 4a pilus biogenesis protein PilO [Candidatus Microgenomates bacterium]|nr:type 4a pilus biogenesis protein PilO [Candidatus Microgenomates bacterium]
MRLESERYFRYFTHIKPVVKLPIVRTYGTAIFTILVMIVFILFAIKPTIETIVVLQKKLENANQILDQLKKKATDLTLGKQNYENLNPNIKTRIQTAIPDTVELKSLIQTLELMASKNEASISALQVQPLVLEVKKEDTIGTLGEIEFTFNIENSYPRLVSLLQELNTSVRLISIDSLNISKVGEGEGLIMSLSGKAYFIK